MATRSRLRDVVVAQHRRLLTVIARAESSLSESALRRVGKSVETHLNMERELLFPLEARTSDGAYGAEQHLVLRFALERLLEGKTTHDRSVRLRVLRDLFVHHIERTEWVTLPLLEAPASRAAGRPAQARRKRR